jgi:hypothetical protein
VRVILTFKQLGILRSRPLINFKRVICLRNPLVKSPSMLRTLLYDTRRPASIYRSGETWNRWHEIANLRVLARVWNATISSRVITCEGLTDSHRRRTDTPHTQSLVRESNGRLNASTALQPGSAALLTTQQCH